MSFEETEGIGTARQGKGVRDVEGQWAPTSVSAVTEAVLGEAMPLVIDVQNWQGGQVGGGVDKQVYAMSCLSDVSRHICSQQDSMY